MSSTAGLIETNVLSEQRQAITRALTEGDALLVLHFLFLRKRATATEIAQTVGLPLQLLQEVLARLTSANLVSVRARSYELTIPARRRLSHRIFSFRFMEGRTIVPSQAVGNSLRNSYKLKECIGSGATSFTFRAEQERTGRDRALKIFLPDTVDYEHLEQAVKARTAALSDDAAIPDVVELGNIQVVLPEGNSVTVPCIAFRFIPSAITFAEFLENTTVLNAAVFERFVERVGGALATIEAAGLHHGDLHEGNILVVTGATPSQAKEFWVIDFIGVPSAASDQLELPSDLDQFKNHLLNAALVASKRHPGVPATVILGEKVFRVLQTLRAAGYHNFAELMADFSRETRPVPAGYFRPPMKDPFHGLRVEALDDVRLLYELFVPVPSRFDRVSAFGNTWISGPRGCGKSHYLRILEFNPEVLLAAERDQELKAKLRDLNYDFRSAFGVLFPCRPGEFKPFVPAAIGAEKFDQNTISFLKHILVLKVWNKTLAAIARGYDGPHPIFGSGIKVEPLVRLLEQRVGSIGLIDSDPEHLFRQCVSACGALESSALAVWNSPQYRPVARLSEQDIESFFLTIRQVVPELATTRFYVLVDDVSHGNVHWEMQKVINSLIRSSQGVHCFKISFDKYMYTLDTVDDRPIDPRHEVTYLDLGEISGKTQKQSKADKITAVDLPTYMEQVINVRLRKAGYLNSIVDILGPSQSAQEFLSALAKRESAKRVTAKEHRAYYAGWNIILSLAHGSVRTLLQLVEEIFRSTGASPNTASIPLSAQDAAVRKFSTRHYSALSMLPEDQEGTALGPKLQSVISAIGRISRDYLLNYDTKVSNRWYETISIERLDTDHLDGRADRILFELVKYGLVVNEGVTFSRAQFGLTARYDLNKVFSPAFQITYRVRNHLYLSSSVLEELLLRPDQFIRRHRGKLAKLAIRPSATQKSLFRE